MLDLSSIDLEEIADALSDRNDYEHCRLINPDTGEVVFWTADTGIDGQTPVDLDELDMLVINPLPSWVWYQDMADFANGITDERVGRRLARAIEGRGAFRRFKDELNDEYPDHLPAWYAFRDTRARRRAVEWLAENDLIEDSAADRFLSDHPDPDLAQLGLDKGQKQPPDRFCPPVPARPARKRSTPEGAASARHILLDRLAGGTEVFELASEITPLHPRNDTFPGEVFLEVAADALHWCQANRGHPLALEGMKERFLPDCAFRGRQNKKLQFAILAAASLHGGTAPDLLDEVVWWQTDDFWMYALYAAVAYIRAAADRAGVPVDQVCRELEA